MATSLLHGWSSEMGKKMECFTLVQDISAKTKSRRRKDIFLLSRLFWVLWPLLILHACLPVPMSGRDRFTEKDTFNIRPEVTSKSQVINCLGEPDIFWETERIYVYKWDRLQAVVIGFIPAGYTGQIFALPLEEQKALLIQFNENDRVKRIGTATRPPFKSYGDFLVDWLDQGSKTTPQPKKE